MLPTVRTSVDLVLSGDYRLFFILFILMFDLLCPIIIIYTETKGECDVQERIFQNTCQCVPPVNYLLILFLRFPRLGRHKLGIL